MIFKINTLRKLIDKQLNADEINWEQIEKLSNKLDKLILEYWKIKKYEIEKDKSNSKKLV